MKNKKTSILYTINPANLSKEISRYGGNPSIAKNLGIFAVFIIALGVIGYLFHMEIPYLVITIAVSLLFLPGSIIRTYQKMYYNQTFSDVTAYMLQMMDSFRNFRKISKALNDTMAMFPTGPMHDTLAEAQNELLTNVDGNNEAHALYVVEKAYPCRKLALLHSFLLRAENIGGNVQTGLDILQRDRVLWVDRVKDLQAIKSGLKRLVIIAIVACAIVVFIAEYYMGDILPIWDSPVSQWTSIILILADIILYVIADRLTTVDWLSAGLESKDIMKKRDYVLNFDVKKQLIKNGTTALVILAGLLAIYLITNEGLVWLGAFVAAYMVVIPFLKLKNYRKEVQLEVELSFSSWLMQIGLELQNKTVQASISNSLSYAPEVLKPDIELMMERLEENPTSPMPYTKFMEDFYSTDINQAMRSLYAISAGSGGDVDERIKEMTLIAVNNQNKLDKTSQEDKCKSQEYMLILSSGVPLTLKVALDFLVSIFNYIGSFGSMTS